MMHACTRGAECSALLGWRSGQGRRRVSSIGSVHEWGESHRLHSLDFPLDFPLPPVYLFRCLPFYMTIRISFSDKDTFRKTESRSFLVMQQEIAQSPNQKLPSQGHTHTHTHTLNILFTTVSLLGILMPITLTLLTPITLTPGTASNSVAHSTPTASRPPPHGSACYEVVARGARAGRQGDRGERQRQRQRQRQRKSEQGMVDHSRGIRRDITPPCTPRRPPPPTWESRTFPRRPSRAVSWRSGQSRTVPVWCRPTLCAPPSPFPDC